MLLLLEFQSGSARLAARIRIEALDNIRRPARLIVSLFPRGPVRSVMFSAPRNDRRRPVAGVMLTRMKNRNHVRFGNKRTRAKISYLGYLATGCPI